MPKKKSIRPGKIISVDGPVSSSTSTDCMSLIPVVYTVDWNKPPLCKSIDVYQTDFGTIAIHENFPKDKLALINHDVLHEAIEKIYVMGANIGKDRAEYKKDDTGEYMLVPFDGVLWVPLEQPLDEYSKQTLAVTNKIGQQMDRAVFDSVFTDEADPSFVDAMRRAITDKAMLFRGPEHIDCAPLGDTYRYLWVVEPIRGFIYGKAYTVTFSELVSAVAPNSLCEEKKKAAYEEMLLRVGQPRYRMPEGSPWESFK